MNKRLMQRWVKALRSGEYKQGSGLLQDNNGNFCCLGVLCEIEGIQYNKGFTSTYQGSSLRTTVGLLPKRYKARNGKKFNSLAGLNDYKLTFKQIARIIEKNYKDL